MDKGPKHISEVVKLPKTTRGERRLYAASEEIFGQAASERGDLGYLLSLHAHVYLPRKKTDKPRHIHNNGPYSVLVDAGPLFDPRSQEWIDQPLPYGGKPRALLAFVSSYAKRHKTREVPLGESFTDFVRLMAGSATGGNTGSLTMWRKQFSALAASNIKLAVAEGDKAKIKQLLIAEDIELWFAREPGQMSLFPSSITLTDAYYDLVQDHAMPIDWGAFRALQHDPLALDVYLWLTWRLPRVRQKSGTLVPWAALHLQFGPEYARQRRFREAFSRALIKAMKVYHAAKVQKTKTGLVIHPSRPAIAKKAKTVIPLKENKTI